MLTKDNLLKRAWEDDTGCESETIDHLSVQCKVVHEIWQWIADYNMFPFDCVSFMICGT